MCSVKKGVRKNFANFTKKKTVLESLVNKVAGLSLQLYYKGDSGTAVFL